MFTVTRDLASKGRRERQGIPGQHQPACGSRSSWPTCSGAVTQASDGPGPGSWGQVEPGCAGSQLVRNARAVYQADKPLPQIPLKSRLCLLPLQPCPLKPFIKPARLQSALPFVMPSIHLFIHSANKCRLSIYDHKVIVPELAIKMNRRWPLPSGRPQALRFTKHLHTSGLFYFWNDISLAIRYFIFPTFHLMCWRALLEVSKLTNGAAGFKLRYFGNIISRIQTSHLIKCSSIKITASQLTER